jgi:hypothetical protein
MDAIHDRLQQEVQWYSERLTELDATAATRDAAAEAGAEDAPAAAPADTQAPGTTGPATEDAGAHEAQASQAIGPTAAAEASAENVPATAAVDAHAPESTELAAPDAAAGQASAAACACERERARVRFCRANAHQWERIFARATLPDAERKSMRFKVDSDAVGSHLLALAHAQRADAPLGAAPAECSSAIDDADSTDFVPEPGCLKLVNREEPSENHTR